MTIQYQSNHQVITEVSGLVTLPGSLARLAISIFGTRTHRKSL